MQATRYPVDTKLTAAPVATINGVPLNAPTELLSDDELRQRACSELLRQAAVRQGLLSQTDTAVTNGILSEAASDAIEQLLEGQLDLPEPSEAACQRHFAAHQLQYTTGEHVRARHILFAVTPGIDIAALRNRAETTLLNVRCHDGADPVDRFASAARSQSNCPSGAEGGDLGWLTSADCAPEFAKELFGHSEVGVLPRLVHSRFGLHVVEVQERKPGQPQPYASVRGAVASALRQSSYVTALRQYLSLLAGQADVQGVALEAADTPLVQ